MEEVNLRDVSEAAPDRLRSKTVYRSSEVVGYVSLQIWHTIVSIALFSSVPSSFPTAADAQCTQASEIERARY